MSTANDFDVMHVADDFDPSAHLIDDKSRSRRKRPEKFMRNARNANRIARMAHSPKLLEARHALACVSSNENLYGRVGTPAFREWAREIM
jgi:hypothetical protein